MCTPCSVSWCFNTSGSKNTAKEVKFFHFPRNPDLSHKWILFTEDPNLMKYWEEKKQSSKSWKICSVHFTAQDFCNKEQLKLKPGSIPTISHSSSTRRGTAFDEVAGTGVTISSPLHSPSISNLDTTPSTSFSKFPSTISNPSFPPSVLPSSLPSSSSCSPTSNLSTPCTVSSPDFSESSFLNSFPPITFTPHRSTPRKQKHLLLSDIGFSRLKYCSPRFLRSMVALPHSRTPKRILSPLPFTTGIDNQALSIISQYLNQTDACNRMCVLMFDEISLKPHLDYRAKSDLIVGFEDHGHLGRCSGIAKYALVFMVRSLLQEWKQPIAVYFSSSPTKSEVLVKLMGEVLQQCKKACISVTAIVCDMGTNNVKTLETMGSTVDNPVIFYEGVEIVTIFDPPNLLKSTRNLLMKYDIKLQVDTGNLQFEGRASWQDIYNAYVNDKAQPQSFRCMPKLSEIHINPKGRSKMSVCLAAQVLSRSVSSFLMCGVSNGFLPQKAIGTAYFLQQANSMFDAVNGVSDKSRAQLQGSVTHSSGHIGFWRKAREEVKTWKLCGEKGPLPQPPTFRGWLITLRGMEIIWEKVKATKRGSKFLGQFSPCHINQDALENLFGCLRALGGSIRDPTVLGFMDAWKSCIINGLAIGDILKGRNYQSDDVCLLSTSSPLLEVAGVAPLQDSTDICEAAAVSVSVAHNNISCNSAAEVCRTLTRHALLHSSCDECRNGLLTTSPFDWMDVLSEELGELEQLHPSEKFVMSVVNSLQLCHNIIEANASRSGISRVVRDCLEGSKNFEWVGSVCEDHGWGIKDAIESKLTFSVIQYWCVEKNRDIYFERLNTKC